MYSRLFWKRDQVFALGKNLILNNKLTKLGRITKGKYVV